MRDIDIDDVRDRLNSRIAELEQRVERLAVGALEKAQESVGVNLRYLDEAYQAEKQKSRRLERERDEAQADVEAYRLWAAIHGKPDDIRRERDEARKALELIRDGDDPDNPGACICLENRETARQALADYREGR